MKEHPIIFSTPMVKAIQDGCKTQTRRVIKITPDDWELKRINHGTVALFWPIDIETDGVYKLIKCPYGQVGDQLWVRETFSVQAGDFTLYKADGSDEFNKHIKWFPSIFMPRANSRITLEITEIRVERVQDITPDDCLKEGVELPAPYIGCDPATPPDAWSGWTHKRQEEWIKGQARATYFTRCADVQQCFDAFIKVWDSINGKKHPWSSNPWVWVVSFKVVN